MTCLLRHQTIAAYSLNSRHRETAPGNAM